MSATIEEVEAPSAYDLQRAKELAEQKRRKAKAIAKLKAACQCLAGRFRLETTEPEWDQVDLISRQDDEARICVWLPTRYGAKGRFSFSCVQLRSKVRNGGGHGYYNSATDPKITVDGKRPAAAIAKDLARRFLPEFWKSRRKHKASRDEADQRFLQQIDAMVRLGDAWGDPFDKRDDRSYYGTRTLYPKNVPGMNRVQISDYCPEGRCVSLELHSLTADEAIEVGKTLRRLAGLPEFEEKVVSLWD